ncbi:uncharacterized protein LAESUDRAFT_720854 [Laetiporus sulphureus 93-53]|uniref:ABM domain-containing protein n=1 Tax=Laetiporus sulphureus 93-53 TaxID=1314785 RepID=A0A165HDU1_9APHY|nr:uncharacterized protein LAESUDRAFT_720854 [Laetiporus sulphureus 93-53]KZT11603.1 hypothetical protein LAESUDRAFT_720854 [Laetiporus sulphureus 93-53]
MSLPCIEVAEAPSTEALLASPKDKSLVQPALDLLKNSKGIVKIYYGLQSEERKHCYVYNIWERLQDHENLQADAVNYPILQQHCSNVMASASDMILLSEIHIQPAAEPYKALSAPTTELGFITIKPGVSKATVEAKTKELVANANKLPAEWGVISAVWGRVVEKDDTLALVIGWTSVEQHWKTVSTVPEVVAQLDDMRKVADIALTHSELSEWH